MLQRIKNWWPDNSRTVAIGLTILIVFTSLFPTESLPKASIHISDKLLHSTAYIFLIWAWLMVFRNKNRLKTAVLLVFLLTIFGIILELLQGMITSYRTPDWKDALANLVGLCIGFFTFKVFYKYIYKT